MKPIIKISALSACVFLAACGGSSSSGGGGATLGESSSAGNIDIWEYAIPAKTTTLTYQEFGYWEGTWDGYGLENEDWEIHGNEATVTYRDDGFEDGRATYKQSGNNIKIVFEEIDDWDGEPFTFSYNTGRYVKDGKTYKDSEGDLYKAFGPKKNKTIKLPAGVTPQKITLNDYIIIVAETKWVDEWEGETSEEYDISISYYEKDEGFVFGYDFDDCRKGLDLKADVNYYMDNCEDTYIEVLQPH